MKPSCILAALGVLPAACNPAPPSGAQATPAPPTPSAAPAFQITAHGASGRPVTVEHQSGNRKVYQLAAHSYAGRSAENIAQGTFAQPTVTFFDKDGTTLTARSPTASLQGDKQVVLSGGVHAKTSSGLTMTCDRLTYDQRTGLLHGSGNVRIAGMQGGTKQVLTGNSFTSDVKLTRMVMK